MPKPLLAFAFLIATALTLRVRGFGTAYRHAAAANLIRPRREVSVNQTMRAFLSAENFVFFRRGVNDCLVRSLALFRYLRWSGVAATHVIGVRRVPFAAHAWVEIDGKGVFAAAPRGYDRLAELTLAAE